MSESNAQVVHRMYYYFSSTSLTLLDLVTTFSQDIRMKFEESKSAYLTIERGKQKYTTEILEINGTKIQPIKEDMTYKCLGVE